MKSKDGHERWRDFINMYVFSCRLSVWFSGFPARPGSKDCVSSQLFGSCGSTFFGTELAPKAIDVLGP